jgi:hypothetical protein
MISKWNKMISFQPDVFNNMEIIFVENLTDNEGNICEGIARIHYRFFCWFPVKVIMINYDYVKNMTELDNLNRLIVHEYIHHWLYLNYDKWDKLHIMFEMWEHKER